MLVHMVTLCSPTSASSFSTVQSSEYTGEGSGNMLNSMLCEGREPHLSQAWSVGRPSSSAWCFAFTSLTSATARAVSGGPSDGPHSRPPLHAPA